MNGVIHFDDKARAMKFYSDCFGWQLNEMQEMDYVMAGTVETGEDQVPKQPGAINGGLFQRVSEAPDPVIYVGVDSVDAAIEKVTGA